MYQSDLSVEVLEHVLLNKGCLFSIVTTAGIDAL